MCVCVCVHVCECLCCSNTQLGYFQSRTNPTKARKSAMEQNQKPSISDPPKFYPKEGIKNSPLLCYFWSALFGQNGFLFAPGFEPTFPRGSTPAKAHPTHLWCSRKFLPCSPWRACKSTILSIIYPPFPPRGAPNLTPNSPPMGSMLGGAQRGIPLQAAHDGSLKPPAAI